MGSKSRFLEELISEKLTPSTNIIDSIWNVPSPEINTVSSSILESLTSDTTVLTNGDAWINSLQVHNYNSIPNTVSDTSLVGLSQVTKNLQALPITKRVSDTANIKYNRSTLPEKFMVCELAVSKGSSYIRTIEILFPKAFSRSITSTFSKQNPIGSSKAIMSYAFTDSETIPFSFDCLSEYLPEGYTSLTTYIDDIMDILKPSTTNNVVKQPRVKLTIADLQLDCVCTSVSVDYDMLFNGSTNENSSFAHAVVTLQLTRI